MNDVILVRVTFPSMADARQIGTVLVEKQLVACVNLIPHVESIFRWQGKICSDQEVIAEMKSRSHLLTEIESLINEMHPYEVPALIALPAEFVSKPFSDWVDESVKPA